MLKTYFEACDPPGHGDNEAADPGDTCCTLPLPCQAMISGYSKRFNHGVFGEGANEYWISDCMNCAITQPLGLSGQAIFDACKEGEFPFIELEIDDPAHFATAVFEMLCSK